jgi:flagellar protein FliO/FliZ
LPFVVFQLFFMTAIVCVAAAAVARSAESPDPPAAGRSESPLDRGAGPITVLPVVFEPSSARPTPAGAGDASAGGSNTGRGRPLRLAPRSEPREPPPGFSPSSDDPAGTTLTVAGSLALVLGLFFVLVWLVRRGGSRATAPLPEDVVELLGRAPLPPRQHVHLLRVGRKLVLVAVNGDEARPLTEITEPEEVDRLAGLCRQRQTGSISGTFQEMLANMGNDSRAAGLAEGREPPPLLGEGDDVAYGGSHRA